MWKRGVMCCPARMLVIMYTLTQYLLAGCGVRCGRGGERMAMHTCLLVSHPMNLLRYPCVLCNPMRPHAPMQPVAVAGAGLPALKP